MKTVIVKPGRDKSLRRFHPWVFSGAIAREDTALTPGETVTVSTASGEFLAYAAYSPSSQIRARAWSFDAKARIDDAFMQRAVARAIEFRRARLGADLEAVRWVHGESDALPGLIVDRYADTVVMQCSSAGAERWRDAFARTLMAQGGVARVFERSDTEVRTLEGLGARSGPLLGDAPPESIRVRDSGACFLIDVRRGQKTGFFLDQRDNRALVREAARDREVLDLFCYTGGFSIAAILGGARNVTALDSSEAALAQARQNVSASGLDFRAIEWIEGNAFKALRDLHGAGRRFDLIVLDPPKFAPTEKHVARAARAYKDINLWALRLLRAGGLLFTFSCSGGVREELFQSIVAGAAVDAGVSCRILKRLQAAADHPLALSFPEGAYLKGLLLCAC